MWITTLTCLCICACQSTNFLPPTFFSSVRHRQRRRSEMLNFNRLAGDCIWHLVSASHALVVCRFHIWIHSELCYRRVPISYELHKNRTVSFSCSIRINLIPCHYNSFHCSYLRLRWIRIFIFISSSVWSENCCFLCLLWRRREIIQIIRKTIHENERKGKALLELSVSTNWIFLCSKFEYGLTVSMTLNRNTFACAKFVTIRFIVVTRTLMQWL